jgi:RpiB/LacA/LacB family sugar-phosphate isomerase
MLVGMKAKRILTVCTGNSCRSPMAEGLLRRILREGKIESVEVRSAGTITGGGSPASEGSILACREVDVDLGLHRSTRLTPELIRWADLVLCMEHQHAARVMELVPSASAKTHLLGEYGIPDDYLEISDPVGMSLSDYRRCRDRMFECLLGLLPELNKKVKNKETILVGCDGSHPVLKKALITFLQKGPWHIEECYAANLDEPDDLGSVEEVARHLSSHSASYGVMIGLSGIGMSIAANKIPGVRAAVCPDPETAHLARQMHNTNLLCLPSSKLNKEQALAILKVWLETEYDDTEDEYRAGFFNRLEYEFNGD